MKKQLAILSLALCSPLALADVTPLFSFYAGAGSWTGDPSGYIGDSANDLEADIVSDLGYTEQDNTYFYVGLEHPVPLLPNVRLEQVGLTYDGSGELSKDFSFGDQTYTQTTQVDSSITLDFTDVTLYYNILMVDLGVTLRSIDAEAEATGDVNGTPTTERESVTGVLPMLYAATKLKVPGTGLYAAGNINALSVGDNSVTDYRVAVGYDFKIPVLAEIGVEVGQRKFEIDLGDEEDLSANVELSGVYFGLNVKF